MFDLAWYNTFPVWLGWLGLDDRNSDNRSNSVQLELELGLSLAIKWVNTKAMELKCSYQRYFDLSGENAHTGLADWLRKILKAQRQKVALVYFAA